MKYYKTPIINVHIGYFVEGYGKVIDTEYNSDTQVVTLYFENGKEYSAQYCGLVKAKRS